MPYTWRNIVFRPGEDNILSYILLRYLRHAFFVNISRTYGGKYFDELHIVSKAASRLALPTTERTRGCPCSNVRGCPYSDKVNIFICRYAWHYECFHPRLYFIQNIFPVSQRLSQTCGIRFLFKITVDIVVLFILVCFAWIRKQFLNRRREKIENKEQRSYYDRKYFSRLFIYFFLAK